MPLSQLSSGLQSVATLLPGTYGTALVRYHALRGVMSEMLNIGVPSEVVEGIKDSIDCNIYFFGHAVSEGAMYGVLVLFSVLTIGAYILAMTWLSKRKGGERKLIRKKNKK